MKQNFRAPWSSKLRITTGLVLAFFMVMIVALPTPASWIIGGVLIVSAALAVQGYSIQDGNLLIHRLGWATRYDLSSLVRVEVNPGATIGSIRTWGVGGLLGFVGYFRNALLGSYRAYATNQENSVILEFSETKVVVTPETPEEFAALVSRELDATPSEGG